MFIIKNKAEVEITEKKSKFITRIFHIEHESEINSIIKEIKKKEKGARHNCFAYRILTDKNSITERKNDDGEPGGTAGAPMLAVLTGEDLINTLVITTRYFGGIKLGTGGLVNAYKTGVKEVLKSSGKKEYVLLKKWDLTFPINNIKHADYLLKNIKIIEKKFIESTVTYIIEVPRDQEKNLIDITKKTNGKLLKLGDL
jgi:uncharacterized YigZ family protein